jgi:prevent-host-death family protein
MEVNVHQAKTHLSRLLQRVAAGEEITIADAGVPVARLVPIENSALRQLGVNEGKIWMAEDFDAPGPEIEALFGGAEKPKRKRDSRK